MKVAACYRKGLSKSGGVIKYPIRLGKFVLIDRSDLETAQAHPWTPLKGRHTTYAVIPGKTIYLHRLLMNAPFGITVDHLNQDGLDNRRANLRLATPAQNQWNRGRKSNNPLPFKGVFAIKDRFLAQIRFNKTVITLGNFKDIICAAHAYDDAAIRYHGKFAYLNFPHDVPVGFERASC